MMSKHILIPSIIGVAIVSVTACTIAASSPTTASSTSIATSPPRPNLPPKLSRLFNKVWRVTTASTPPARGSIYIFLADGSLLETSCVEPYRIAKWTLDKTAPQVLNIVEDGRLVAKFKVRNLTDTTLQVDRTLVPNGETESIAMSAIRQEFICPDLPKK